jgi:hypothetical protein
VKEEKIRVRISGRHSDTAYVSLPGYPVQPQPGVVSKTICLDDLVADFRGARVHLDFDRDGVLIGIEILAFGLR